MAKAKLAGKPKRPMSSYFLWMNDVGRAEVKKKNPDASITEISKECGAAWANIDAKTKEKYDKKKDEAKKAVKAKPAKKTKKKKKVESSEDEKSASEAED